MIGRVTVTFQIGRVRVTDLAAERPAVYSPALHCTRDLISRLKFRTLPNRAQPGRPPKVGVQLGTPTGKNGLVASSNFKLMGSMWSPQACRSSRPHWQSGDYFKWPVEKISKHPVRTSINGRTANVCKTSLWGWSWDRSEKASSRTLRWRYVLLGH